MQSTRDIAKVTAASPTNTDCSITQSFIHQKMVETKIQQS